MKEEINQINGITFNIFEKNNHDVVIKVLAKDKIYFFIAKGFLKKESKNKSNISIGSISNFEFFNNYGNENYFLLKKATIEHAFDFNSHEIKSVLEKIFYILQQIEESNQNIFETYKYFLEEKDFFNKNLFITYLLNLTLKTKGKGINNCFCSICGTNQNLYCFDVNEGGILCFNHKKETAISKLDYLKAFYYLGKSYEEYKRNTNESINNVLFNILYNFNKN